MTRDEILKMPAGREMDALIAEKVMGWKKIGKIHPDLKCDLIGENPHYFYPPDGEFDKWMDLVPHYSTDANDMLLVSDNLKSRGFNARIEIQSGAHVTIWKTDMTEYGPEPINAKADSIPLAICRAALLAVTGEN